MFANELNDLARERSSIYTISEDEKLKIVLDNILRSAACGNYHYYFPSSYDIKGRLEELGYDVTLSKYKDHAPHCSWIFKDLQAKKIATFYNGNQKLFDTLFESMKRDANLGKFMGEYQVPDELHERVKENLRIRGFRVSNDSNKIVVSWMNPE